MISLFIGTDLFKGNISGSTSDLFYLIRLWLFALSYGICVYHVFKMIDHKASIIALISIILATIIPYDIDLAIMSDIHVLLAYIGFFGLTITYVYILFHYRIYDRRLSDILFKVMGAILVFILGLYLYFFGVNGFMEVIYLTAMITITLIIELDYARISTGNKR